MLEQKEGSGKGRVSSHFLTKEAYRELIDLQNQGVLRFQKQALVLEGTLHYLPARHLSGTGSRKLKRLERKSLCRSMAPSPGALSRKFL